MTEAEWLACTDPWPMLEFLRGKASNRKTNLFGLACCLRVRRFLDEPVYQSAFELLEGLGDGHVGEQALEAACKALPKTFHNTIDMYASRAIQWMLFQRQSPWEVVADVAAFARDACSRAGLDAEGPHQCSQLRDIIGNPFRPLVVDPAWNSGTVVHLAQAIYADRAFDRMPILADALEDAGCTNQEVLLHCRSGGEHVRGCWLLDLLLGKE